MIDPDVAAAVRQALDGDPEWHQVSSTLARVVPEGDEARFRSFAFAFGYRLVPQTRRETQDRASGPFAPMASDGDWSFPPALPDVEDGDVHTWKEAVGELPGPVALARLHDLLWERGAQPRHVHGQAATEALLELVDLDHWHIMGRTDCLSRALELATALNNADLRARAVARSQAFIEDVIALEERAPGAVLMILRALIALRDEHRPTELAALMESAKQRYGDDPYIFESLGELRARLLSGDEQIGVRRAQVARWRLEATKGDTMMRVIRLEQALEVARTYGLTSEADEIRVELQNIRPADVDLKTISATVALPTEEIEQWIDSIVSPGWQEALSSLGRDGPPGGTNDEIDQQLAEEGEDFVFSKLFTRQVMGHETAATRFRAADDESRESLERSERRAMYARMSSAFYARALLAIEERHERPTHDDLADFFSPDLIGPQRGERIARALELFWDGLPDESAHVLVPRIESTIREMARRVGLTVMREPVAGKPGGARTLGILLLELREHFTDDDGWIDYLYNVLGDQFGLNLRNDISHGLIDSVGVGDAALLLHGALHLRLLQPRQKATDEQHTPHDRDAP